MSRCQFKINETDQKVELLLSGMIDETFPVQGEQINAHKELVVHLGEIKMINSLGIREWIKFMQKLQNKKIGFIECPKIFIDQANMVQGFLPVQAKILSFYVPYYNEDADAEKNVLYTYGKDYTDDAVNIPAIVKSDEGDFEIDVVESKYYKFLKKA